MKATHFHFQWLPEGVPSGFRTGVSLHSHTLHSKESLDFIYAAAKRSASVWSVLRYWEARYRRHHSVPLDLRRGWWTPPLAPLDAHKLEAHQIESLGLAPIVSLTDHDDIEAPMSVQSIDPSRTIPVSVEWTVPYGATFFHLGIHNIPSRRARSLMATLAEFTANPHDAHVTGILSTLHAIAGVLLVFNHPLWDEKGVGSAVHREATLRFLRQCGPFLHAIEMNGLRPWRENRLAICLAQEWSKPIVSGGDRHALEPNVVLNFTQAATFAEFAQEIRDGLSNVFVTGHYRQSHTSRIIHNVLDVLQPYEQHGLGWREWPDRVFYQGENGVARSVRELWGDHPPRAIRVFDRMMQFAGNGSIRNAMRAVSSRGQQVIV